MKNKDIIILTKILSYIKELHDFIHGYTYDTFRHDKKTINACVFNLSQIGELTGKISNELMNDNPRNRMAWFKIIKKSNSTRL